MPQSDEQSHIIYYTFSVPSSSSSTATTTPMPFFPPFFPPWMMGSPSPVASSTTTSSSAPAPVPSTQDDSSTTSQQGPPLRMHFEWIMSPPPPASAAAAASASAPAAPSADSPLDASASPQETPQAQEPSTVPPAPSSETTTTTANDAEDNVALTFTMHPTQLVQLLLGAVGGWNGSSSSSPFAPPPTTATGGNSAAALPFFFVMPHGFPGSAQSFQGQPPASNEAIKSQLKHTPGDSSQTCGICLKSFCTTETMTSMVCDHPFHSSCLLTWLKSSNTCPHCRYEIFTDNEDYNLGVKERMAGRDSHLQRQKNQDQESGGANHSQSESKVLSEEDDELTLVNETNAITGDSKRPFEAALEEHSDLSDSTKRTRSGSLSESARPS